VNPLAQPQQPGGSGFLNELRRRHVVRVAAVYMATAFVVLQAVQLLAEGLRLSPWILTAATILAIAGLPVALVLGWIFELTPEGVRRTQSSDVASPRAWLPLRTLALVVLLLAIGGAVGYLLRPAAVAQLAGAAASGDAAASLAVLPFTNLGQPDDEYFAEGMADAVRGKLAGLEGLTVIASTSTRPYAGTNKPPQEIGRELGVRYLLTGTVHWARAADGGSRVQVRPELVAAADGTTQWQQPFDAVISDVFAVQGEIAVRVADALSLRLLESQRRLLTERPTQNVEAYDAFLRASALLRQAEIGAITRRHAADGFRRAVELDPGFALAWALMSYAHSGAFWFLEDGSDQRLRLARGAADTALALQPRLAEAHIADGYYWYWGWRSYERATAAFRQARELDPNSATAVRSLGYVLRRQGRWQEAVVHLRRALELDPRDAVLHRELAKMLVVTDDLAEAERLSARAVALAPEALGGYLFRTLVQYAAERSAEAHATLREAITVLGVERMAVDMANRSWARWVPLTDSTTWRSLEHLPLSSAVVDTGSFYLLRADWLLHTGRRAHAVALADSALPFLAASVAALPRDWWYWGQVAHAHAIAGRAAPAAEHVRRLLATLQERPDAWDDVEARYHAAKVMAALGDRDAAIAHLQSVAQRSGPLPPAFIRADGRFARLHGDPRYEALVRRR
jgi:TolB-like protein/Tfp pilus assembly protein PilF